MGGVSTTQAAEQAEPMDAAERDHGCDHGRSGRDHGRDRSGRDRPQSPASARSQAGPQPRHPAAAARGRRGLSRRARLGGLHGLRRRRARGSVPGGRPAPLPHPRGPVHRRGGVRRRGALHRIGALLPESPTAARWSWPWSTSTPAPSSAPPSTSGSPPPTRSSSAPGSPWRPAWAARRTGSPWNSSPPTNPAQGVRETVQGLLDMSRGLGLANLLTNDGGRRERVVAQWGVLLDEALG